MADLQQQTYALVNQITNQVLGRNDISVIDTGSLISIGDEILSSAVNVDNFFKVLVNRIARTEIAVRNYAANMLNVLRDSFEFGAYLQRIRVELMEAEADPAWSLEDGGTVDQYRITKPESSQQLFSSSMVWQIRRTIPTIQIKTAFTSAEAMTAFVAGIRTQIENSMQLKLESAAIACYSNFIGHLFLAGGQCARNLLAEYNALPATTTPLTVAGALYDRNFLRYSISEIALTSDYMTSMSVLFNPAKFTTFSSKEQQRISVLSQYSQSVSMYLQADTYHRELVELPNFEKINYLSGTGLSADFNSNSSINVTIKEIGSSTTHTIAQSGIIAMISDMEAMGMTFNERRNRSAFNEEGEYENIFLKANVGYYNDLSHNGVVFYIADTSSNSTKSSKKI